MPLVPLKPFKTPRRAAAAQVVQTAVVPAPVGGLNYRDPISAMAPTDALALVNFIPKQLGVELRKGWKVNTDAIEDVSIESIFGFKAPNPSDDKVFAAADGKIYDVTSDPPTVVVATTNSDEDVWWTTQFSTPADTFLLAVSPGAGYWTYDTTGGWVDRTATTMGLPSDVRTVAVWKNRVWFTAEGDQNVYYMDTVDAITGSVTSFPMGSLLRNGGSVSALINWTMDAGLSIDDYLIVVGTEGDIGVWQGTDPTSANTFGLKGVWYVGPVPKYGTYFTPFGGDVMIVSELGLVPMSKLVAGQFNDSADSPASKIQAVFAPLVRKLRNDKFWNVFTVASSDIMVIKLPADGGTYRQFAMNVITGAWCEFSAIPMRCASIIGGELYFGTIDGYTCIGLTGDLDGVDVVGAGGDYIQGDVQTAFNAYGAPANLKKFGMARPIFLARAQPAVKLRMNTQFAFSGVGGSPTFFEPENGYWDTGIWNSATWVGDNTYQAWIGTAALGYYGSMRMRVRGLPGTVFTSSHVMHELGGVM